MIGQRQLASWGFFALLIVANVLTWLAVWSRGVSPRLRVSFLDVGQGDAVLIESPTGNQVLIDGGPGRSVLRELGSSLSFWDRSLDLVVATHPDADHISGLIDVFERYQIGAFLRSGVSSDSALDESLESAAKVEPAVLLLARRGQKIILGGGAVLEILFPDRDPAGMETNDASIVAKLSYGNHEFLFTGDSPEKIERYLIGQYQDYLTADVLKAGHHGSRTSTSQEYLYWVRPRYTVISVGLDNRYGHPHPEVLELLRAASTTILRTDEQGRIIFESDGQELRLMTS